MKNLTQILLIVFALTFIVSCGKDEKEEPEKKLEKSTVSAKWLVGGSSEYKSFEFNESGNYLVVRKSASDTGNDTVLFGTYEIVNNSTLALSNFGNLSISSVNESSITFTMKLTAKPDQEIIITGTKKEEMSASPRTELLCRTWIMDTLYGIPVSGTDFELTVLFSEAGTYFVHFPTNLEEGGLAQWTWKNEAETEIYYSWDEIPVWNDDQQVQILVLTETKLKIHEDGETYVLKPLNN